MSPRMLVIGGTGMLGTAVLREAKNLGLAVTATTRHPDLLDAESRADFVAFDSLRGDVAALVDFLSPDDAVINCAALIKQHMATDDARMRREATLANVMLPVDLTDLAEERGFRVISPATDCVFSGFRGHYTEDDFHDANDVYGQSKSLGEVPSERALYVRASIVGREIRGFASLLEWTLRREQGEHIRGFTDHRWNGVSTTSMARVLVGAAASTDFVPGTRHLIPSGEVTKDALVRMILSTYGRDDVVVDSFETGTPIDRTLATVKPEGSTQLWELGGYERVPTIGDIINETKAQRPPSRGAS